jgi:hypothetical protein
MVLDRLVLVPSKAPPPKIPKSSVAGSLVPQSQTPRAIAQKSDDFGISLIIDQPAVQEYLHLQRENWISSASPLLSGRIYRFLDNLTTEMYWDPQFRMNPHRFNEDAYRLRFMVRNIMIVHHFLPLIVLLVVVVRLVQRRHRETRLSLHATCSSSSGRGTSKTTTRPEYYSVSYHHSRGADRSNTGSCAYACSCSGSTSPSNIPCHVLWW